MQFALVSNWHLETKMGTYTTNYNLFMPSVGETGWGDLVNGNFSTIDSIMGGLTTRLTAVENEVNGNLSCTSVTTSGTITSAGKITANGGLSATTGTFSGTVTAESFNNLPFKQSVTVTPTNTFYPINSGTTLSACVPVLPTILGIKYTGSIKFKNTGNYTDAITYARYGVDTAIQNLSFSANGTSTISFTDCSGLYVTSRNNIFMSGLTFS